MCSASYTELEQKRLGANKRKRERYHNEQEAMLALHPIRTRHNARIRPELSGTLLMYSKTP
jgi:hypothetical protein